MKRELHMRNIISIIAIFLVSSLGANQAVARDEISIVGSSTVYPFSKSVAKRFSQITLLEKPVIQSTGSGGGFALFCEGVGEKFPDITNASRRMKPSELATCTRNGVGDVTEVLIGFDGVSVATSVLVEKIKFTDKDLFLALAKYVPNEEGKFVENTYTTWKQINSSLPDVDIKVYGPPASSGTRDAFAELALAKGAKRFDFLNQLSKLKAGKKSQIESMIASRNIPDAYWQTVLKKKSQKAQGSDLFKSLVYDVRDDGVYIETGENDDLIVGELVSNPYALGIIGFGFLQDNQKRIHGNPINEFEPSAENISKGIYPLSRGLYFYIKKAHISLIPGIKEFADVFMSRIEVGKGGYLERKGLIVMDASTYSAVKKTVKNMDNLEL